MKYFVPCLLLILFAPSILGQNEFKNACYSQNVHTVLVHPVGNPLGNALIGFQSGEILEFHFDVMGTEFNYYNFGVIHCTHDWKQSELEPNEYLQGFQTQSISEFEAAFSTMYDYVHYKFSYPGDMSKPRYSGNYLMVVFDGQDINDRSKWLITYRFVIYESAVTINSRVAPSSIVAERFKMQEVDFDIGHKDFSINDPMRDLNVTIIQNMDWNSSVNNLKPIFIKQDVLTYDYSMGENNFEAGSEYRNFEVKNVRYVSNEVEYIMLEPDGFNVYLRPDLPEGRKAYATWNDLNGNFLVKTDGTSDSNLEGDYVMVHFKLTMPEISESDIIIEGRLNAFNDKPMICKYDKASGSYLYTALLKQGYYNYRYVSRDKYFAKNDLRTTEGSYAATENTYHIILYMYDRMRGYDRVIALKADASAR